MAGSKWTDEQIAEALAIAEATSNREASRRTGIPESTIRAWRKAQAAQPAQDAQRAEAAQKIAAMADEVRQRAVDAATERVTEALTDRLMRMADQLYALAEKAIRKVDRAMDEEEHDRDGAAWLRALVGVLAQATDKAQLLSGKPTVRPEVVDRREIDITHRIVAEHPDLLDAIFAEDQRPGLEDRGGPGALARLGLVRGPDLPEG